MADEELESSMTPETDMNLAEFLMTARRLLDEMEESYEIDPDASTDWEFWSTELSNAYLND